MGDCCSREAYGDMFGDGFARRIARRYRKKGLDRSRQRIVAFLDERGIRDASVLEIGGGVGELQVELLRHGAATATNLELSAEYDGEAAALLDAYGLSSRVTRRQLDIVAEPEQVAPADVVVLHRVVCCYPDYEGLLGEAADHARRLLVFSHPPSNAVSRFVSRAGNLALRLRGMAFRSYIHPPDAMVAAAEAHGMRVRYREAGPVWTVVGLERTGAGPS